MIRRLRILLIVGAAFVGACSDEHQPLPVAPTPPPSLSHVPLTAPQINGQIDAIKAQIGLNSQPGLFPVGPLRTWAQLQFKAIAFDVKCANGLSTVPDPACSPSVLPATYLKRARAKVVLQLWSTIKLLKSGALGDRNSPVLQDKVIAFIVSEANLVGFHFPLISREVFAGDAATGTCTGGTAGGCTFTTSYQTAALHIPSDAIPQGVTVLIFIFRLADETPPVETALNTYPLYYEAFMVRLDAFIGPGATFGACYYFDDETFAPPPSVISRLRIGSPDPTSPTGVKVHDLATPPAGMNCEPRTHLLPPIGSIDFTSPGSIARAAGSLVGHIGSKAIGFFAPRPLYATNVPIAGGGIRVLSPKFIVDPVLPGSSLFGVNSGDDGLSTVDPATGAVSFIARLDGGENTYTTPVAMATDPTTGTIYAWNNSEGDGEFASITGVLLTVDRCTAAGTPVNAVTPPQGILAALALSPTTGNLYGLDSELYSINKSTGVRTLIGSLGGGLTVFGADFDASGTLYALSWNGSALYTVSLVTGAATLVANLSTPVGVVGSIVFTPSGVLLGSSFGGSAGDILFDIDKATGTVSNIRTGSSPQGMGFAPACVP